MMRSGISNWFCAGLFLLERLIAWMSLGMIGFTEKSRTLSHTHGNKASALGMYKPTREDKVTNCEEVLGFLHLTAVGVDHSERKSQARARRAHFGSATKVGSPRRGKSALFRRGTAAAHGGVRHVVLRGRNQLAGLTVHRPPERRRPFPSSRFVSCRPPQCTLRL